MSTLDGMSELNSPRPGLSEVSLPAVPRLTRRETLLDCSIILAWVAASDYLLYRSNGYSAWATFLMVAASVLLIAKRGRHVSGYAWPIAALILACAARLAWCGSHGAIASALVLIAALSMSVNGSPPFLPDMIRYLVHVLVGSGFRLSSFSLRNAKAGLAKTRAKFAILLPLVVVIAFTSIFVLANPDVTSWLDQQFRLWLDSFSGWFRNVDPVQVVCWIVSGWLVLGLLYPAAGYLLKTTELPDEAPAAPSDSYVAVRNMMISVVVLFAAYLCFEFATLWFREFPKGFYYAGYAHEGAFWLTVALALSTLILSLAFRGSIVRDQRTVVLKRWAWIWSFENFLLGIAVFHRLFIYIDFNGMTRMRVVGLLGTLAVMIGFGWVVYKIVACRGFLWLIRQQLWTVALVCVLYTLLPVDYLVHRHNANEILAGNPAPSTQIPTHETSAEGLIPLVALVDSEDKMIREGMRATLANWLATTYPAKDWRDNQWAHQVLRDQLINHLPKLQPYLFSQARRQEEMQRFYDYAYQWY